MNNDIMDEVAGLIERGNTLYERAIALMEGNETEIEIDMVVQLTGLKKATIYHYVGSGKITAKSTGRGRKLKFRLSDIKNDIKHRFLPAREREDLNEVVNQ